MLVLPFLSEFSPDLTEEMSISTHETFAFGAYPRTHIWKSPRHFDLARMHYFTSFNPIRLYVLPYRAFGSQINLLRRIDGSAIVCRKASAGQDRWSHGNWLERENILFNAFI